MREKVIKEEVSQFRIAIGEMYNKTKQKPCITLIIVNKKITQRFFTFNSQTEQYENPPSGTCVDTLVVEDQDDQ